MLLHSEKTSLAGSLRGLSSDEIVDFLSAYSLPQLQELRFDWSGCWARPTQIAPPGAWFVWLVLAGRGFGKTRIGAEWVREKKKTVGRIALVAPTSADVRDTLIEGESGIMACSTPWDRPVYQPSKRKLTWANGAVAYCFSAEEPERLRGPQHGAAWCDELAAWTYLEETWDNLLLGLRLGERPRVCATTTPKPRAMLRKLVKETTTEVTRGSTFDNLENLAPTFRELVLAKYEGTTLGRQELYAELLDETPGALWMRKTIEALRLKSAPPLVRIVVGVDPAATSGEGSAETGIVVSGIGDGTKAKRHGYVLEDCSLRGSPGAWAACAVKAFKKWKADRIIAEANNGGEMVEHTIHTVDPNVPVTLVHASRGKHTRAEPIAALYAQGRWHHVGGFPMLEDQMVGWVPGEISPDRMDAHVWAATALVDGGATGTPRLGTDDMVRSGE